MSDYTPDETEESGTELHIEQDEEAQGVIAHQLKSLRSDLAEARKEAALNLAGWQRAKADLINLRRTTDEERARSVERARHDLVRGVLPAVDSFESAITQADWQSVDPTWRTGVERIAEQLRGVLSREGFTPFGEVGEMFNPSLHECVAVVGTTGALVDGTIAQVFQKGYRVGEAVVRPAKVSVAQESERVPPT